MVKKVLWRVYLTVVLSFIVSANIHADNGNRGGGHYRVCSESKDNSFKGIYFYDYLQTRESNSKENSNEFKFNSKDSCSAINKKIIDKLEKVPLLQAGLKSFAKNYGVRDYSVNGVQRHWRSCEHENCLEQQSHFDPKEREDFPSNCKQRVQLAVRDDWDNKSIVISYDKNANKEIREKAPKQCSYYMIHEWLRDFVTDTAQIEEINKYLHSSDFFNEVDPSNIMTEFGDISTDVERLQNHVICDPNFSEDNIVSSASSQIEELEVAFLQSYSQLLIDLRKKKTVVAGADFKNDLQECVREGAWPYQGLFTTVNYQHIKECIDHMSKYVPFSFCTEQALKYSSQEYKNQAITLIASCRHKHWGDMTKSDCLIGQEFYETKQRRDDLVASCEDLVKRYDNFEKQSPFIGKKLTSPIKKTEAELERERLAEVEVTKMRKEIEFEVIEDPVKREKFRKEFQEYLDKQAEIEERYKKSLQNPKLRKNSK